MKRWIPIACAAVASPASAQLTNASFENPPLNSGQFVNNMPGWSLSLDFNGGVFRPPSTQFDFVPEGAQIGFSNGTAFAQQSELTLTEGVTSVRSWVGRRQSGISASVKIQLFAGGVVSNGHVLGGTKIAEALVSIGNVPLRGWVQETASYTALASDPLLGQLLSVRFEKGDTAQQMNVDMVELIQIVPEPTVILGMGIGIVAVLVQKRK